MDPVDPATVRKLHEDLGGEPEVTRELVDTFLEEAPRLVRGMGEAAGAGERGRADLHRLAHSMRSSAGTFGASRLADLCRALENDTQCDMPPDAASRVEAVAREWDLVAAELRKLRP